MITTKLNGAMYAGTYEHASNYKYHACMCSVDLHKSTVPAAQSMSAVPAPAVSSRDRRAINVSASGRRERQEATLAEVASPLILCPADARLLARPVNLSYSLAWGHPFSNLFCAILGS